MILTPAFKTKKFNSRLKYFKFHYSIPTYAADHECFISFAIVVNANAIKERICYRAIKAKKI
jgi:hypothetical protein